MSMTLQLTIDGAAGETPESIVDPAGRGPRIWFQQVPEPKAAKNRVEPDMAHYGVLLQDPEGNEFCVA